MTYHARKFAALLLVSAAGLLAAGCGDADPTAARAAEPSLAIGIGLQEGIASFQVHPGRARSFVIGDHRISFDADAICEPRTSTYGPGEWDAPCAPASNPVRITATAWTDESGRPRVDFEPALRFRPDARVVIYLQNKDASADLASANILWVDPQGNLVDESLTDPSVATYVGENGFLYRRVKHFSGYVLSTGRLGYGGGGGLEIDLGFRPKEPTSLVPAPLSSGHVVATGRGNVKRAMVQHP